MSLIFELYDISISSKNKLFQDIKEQLFVYVCQGLRGAVLGTLLFTILMIVLILFLVNLLLAIFFVILIIMFIIFLLREQNITIKKIFKIIKILTYSLIGLIGLLIIVIVISLISFSIYFFTSGIEIEMDKNAYYSGDIINIMIQPYGLWGTYITNVSYDNETLLGKGCLQNTKAIPTYCSINSSIFNQTSNPYLIIDYKFRFAEWALPFVVLSQEIYLPYFNDHIFYFIK